MHTTRFKLKETEAYLLHNSDWSGDIRVVIPGRDEVEIPSEAFFAAARAITTDRIEAVVERLFKSVTLTSL
jgi:hypothetical protein